MIEFMLVVGAIALGNAVCITVAAYILVRIGLLPGVEWPWHFRRPRLAELLRPLYSPIPSPAIRGVGDVAYRDVAFRAFAVARHGRIEAGLRKARRAPLTASSATVSDYPGLTFASEKVEILAEAFRAPEGAIVLLIRLDDLQKQPQATSAAGWYMDQRAVA